MKNMDIHVLAVDDPAVRAYTKSGVLNAFPGVCFDVVSWEAYYSTMMGAFSGQEAYDIVMVAGHLWKREFAERGYLAPLPSLHPGLLPKLATEACWQGTPYLSPSFCDGHIGVYRKSQQSGKLPGSVLTPAQYIALAASQRPGTVAMKAHSSEILTDALPFIRMYGGDVYDRSGMPICDEEAAVRGLEAYLSLREYAAKDVETYGNEEVAQGLMHKKHSLGITWSGQMGVVMGEGCEDPQDLGFFTLTTAWNVTWSFAVCEACKQKEQAFALLEFLCSPAVDRIAGKYSGAPVHQSSYTKAALPWYPCQLRMIEEYALPMPDCRNAGERNACLYAQIARAFRGELSAQKAMTQAKQQILAIDRQASIK